MPKILKLKILPPLLIIAIILLLIFFNAKGLLSQPKNLFYLISSPFLKGGQWVGNKISRALSFLFIMGDLTRENKFLKDENQKLFLENNQLKGLALENEVLREQLKIPPDIKGNFVLANVIGRYRTGQEYSFLIDRGSKDGLAVNQAIVAGGGYLVGRISEVSDRLAKILLIIDSNSIINVRIQETRASGVVKGEHGLGLIMEMIPQEHRIQKGEFVITSALGGIFPKGLIVGEVEEIISPEMEVFKKVRLRPFVDFNEIEMVFVVIPPT